MTPNISMSVFKENLRVLPQKIGYVGLTFLFLDICTAILLGAVDRKGTPFELEVNLYNPFLIFFRRA